jgi:hypothetical protein
MLDGSVWVLVLSPEGLPGSGFGAAELGAGAGSGSSAAIGSAGRGLQGLAQIADKLTPTLTPGRSRGCDASRRPARNPA